MPAAAASTTNATSTSSSVKPWTTCRGARRFMARCRASRIDAARDAPGPPPAPRCEVLVMRASSRLIDVHAAGQPVDVDLELAIVAPDCHAAARRAAVRIEAHGGDLVARQ